MGQTKIVALLTFKIEIMPFSSELRLLTELFHKHAQLLLCGKYTCILFVLCSSFYGVFLFSSAQTVLAFLFMNIDPNGVNDALFSVPSICNTVSILLGFLQIPGCTNPKVKILTERRININPIFLFEVLFTVM